MPRREINYYQVEKFNVSIEIVGNGSTTKETTKKYRFSSSTKSGEREHTGLPTSSKGNNTIRNKKRV